MLLYYDRQNIMPVAILLENLILKLKLLLHNYILGLPAGRLYFQLIECLRVLHNGSLSQDVLPFKFKTAF